MLHHTIKPLSRLSASEIRALAQAAADRDEDLDQANPFDHNQQAKCDQFAAAFLERQADLQPAI